MKVWSIANQKGGVGKTTTAITLGGLLSKKGYRVLLIDTDPHASLTSYLGYEVEHFSKNLFDLFQMEKINKHAISDLIISTKIENLDLIPAHMSLATLDRILGKKSGVGLQLKRALKELDDVYDYVLIDCPPVLGVMMVNALAACERIMIPVQTEYLAIKGLERMMRTLTIMQKSQIKHFNVTVVPTMYDKRTRASLHALNQLKKDYSNTVWNSAIPIDTKFRDASLKCLPASHFAEGSRGVFAYKQLLNYLDRLI